jgi:GNAT superfamily N-acetyltransferase
MTRLADGVVSSAKFETDARLDAVYRVLLEACAVEPVALGGEEERAWSDCELATFAEHRLGDRADPRVVDEERRETWRARALSEAPWPLGECTFDAHFWLRQGEERVGTVALGRDLMRGRTARVSSLYVYPSCRRRGIARGALEQIRLALEARDLGLRLSTHWTWQPNVRFYLGLGMWVRSWKRDLEFVWRPHEPRPAIDITDEQARVRIGDVVLSEARRTGDALEIAEHPSPGGALEESWFDALTTLSVAIALRGWPLVRSQDKWEACGGCDAGAPEALAHRIVVWEAWERERGWRVDTPRIAGLAYPTREELEAQWEERSRRLSSPRR